jgi:hypothetical protein
MDGAQRAEEADTPEPATRTSDASCPASCDDLASSAGFGVGRRDGLTSPEHRGSFNVARRRQFASYRRSEAYVQVGPVTAYDPRTAIETVVAAGLARVLALGWAGRASPRRPANGVLAVPSR